MTLKEIADKLGAKIHGDPDTEISGVAGVEQAQEGQLTFLSNPRYARLVGGTKASAIIAAEPPTEGPSAVLISSNPYLDFARALELFYEAPIPPVGIHPTAVISASARVGPETSVGAYVVIGDNVVIGRGAVLHAHVTVYPGVEIGADFVAHSQSTVRESCRIGDRVVLQNAVTVGSDGFGFARRSDGSHHKIPQAGIVVIEDDVEIQAGACIDRAAVGETRIRRGTKIDNLVQIGHAVEVGEDAILCAQVGIAGSTVVGDRCILAGQVGLVNHLNIGDDVVITAQSGVNRDITSGKQYSGYPAIENRQWLRCTAAYNRLPDLTRRVRSLGKKK